MTTTRFPLVLQPLAWRGGVLAFGLSLGLAAAVHPAEANEKVDEARPAAKAESKDDLAARIREGVELSNKSGKKGKGNAGSTYIEVKVPPAPAVRRPSGALANPVDMRHGASGRPETSREALAARAALLAAAVEDQEKPKPEPITERHWGYESDNGPATWSRLKPDFSTCALGQRQSPIHILSSDVLLGPAEPLQLNYLPTTGSVVNNGHTIQVDLDPASPDTLTVRGSTYRLVQFHFHHPAEEMIDYKGFSMVVHLVHRNEQNQLAVVSVLLDPGPANALIDKVWTYMPLDNQDRVTMPPGSLDLNQLLPQDRRYYMFMGSLTTPPCTEGVLWLVLKKPVTLSADQLRLFTRQFPDNARPTQPLNGRVVREAQ